ncbi:hypothetical protein GCG21_02885 [Pseudactinotalea sp. HY160]|uniref:HNH endonuclease signature motif containing protein n=1 Tax=Pseudactinotalea sp. HY160 TaxID=2654490 RepID=UPI00128C51B6|nr:HNH endonuclease signature motif containing protein [Pseudactinotalea sp. HY160]MPV48972.1 hypothetical protein [Pseudactinotalea sp. HY160]
MEMEQLAGEVVDDSAMVARLREGREAVDRWTIERFALAAMWVERHPFVLAADEDTEEALDHEPLLVVEATLGLKAAWEQVEHDARRREADAIHAATDPAVEAAVDSAVAPAVDPGAGSGRRGLWTVEEFSISAFAAAVGMGLEAAERLLLEAEQLRSRLPRLFARVLAGRVRVWRARRIAASTLYLSVEACSFVDSELELVPVVFGGTQLDGLIKEALIRHMPSEYESLQQAAAAGEPRDVVFRHADTAAGDTRMSAVLSAVDARILQDVIGHLAQNITDEGRLLPAGERRASALGDLARARSGQPPLVPGPGERAGSASSDGTSVPRGRILMYLHLQATDLWLARHGSGNDLGQSRLRRVPVRVEGSGPAGGAVMSAEELASMFHRPSTLLPVTAPATALAGTGSAGGDGATAPGAPGHEETGLPATADGRSTGLPAPPGGRGEGTAVPGAARGEGTGLPATTGAAGRWAGPRTRGACFVPEIVIRPVLDLEEPLATDSYTPTERMRAQAILASDACAFPWCTRTARSCDLDHIDPWHSRAGGHAGGCAQGGTGEVVTGGATCPCNIAPLCRAHHRLKTHARTGTATRGRHAAWTYIKLDAGTYLWIGPHGIRLLRTPWGTYDTQAPGARGDGHATGDANPGHDGHDDGGTGDVAASGLSPQRERENRAHWSRLTFETFGVAVATDTRISDRAGATRAARHAEAAEDARRFPDEPPF